VEPRREPDSLTFSRLEWKENMEVSMSAKRTLFILAIVLAFGSLLCAAQESQVAGTAVRVETQPPQAYIFLDGVAMGKHKATLSLSPGKHTIAVYNYGFKPFVKEIDTASAGNETIQAVLEPDGLPAAVGPFGELQVEGAPHAAILLNGKTPEFFVGHGDMTNNHLWWKQQLLLPVGTYDVLVTEQGKDLFSGQVPVNRNERTILYVDKNGEQVIKSWSEGTDIKSRERFKAGRSTATVAVAPVSGNLAANPTAINCNDTVTISWKTDETRRAYLTAEPYVLPDSRWDLKTKIDLPPATTDEVLLTGSKDFQPKVTTKYTLRSPGPGGVVLQSVIVPVNAVVQSHLSAIEEPAHYVKVGDKLLTQDATKFNWTVDNADAITIDEIGNVDAVPARQTVGERTYSPTPKTAAGPVDEKQLFKLSASNVCGGSDIATATVHVVGDVEPNMVSIFFPTAFPKSEHPTIGLLHSQEMQALVPIARAFKIYMEHTPDAKLLVVGNADKRPHQNMKLSERRAQLVKLFFLDMGIPADKIEIQGKGTEQLLDQDAVKELEAKNQTPMTETGARAEGTNTLAYNRRVDVVIVPAALESLKLYPHTADGAALMWNRPVPSTPAVEKKD
jgi:OmpA family/PEGA domain